MPIIRFLTRVKIQAFIYGEGQVVLFPNDLAGDIISSGFGEIAEDETCFVEHINRIEPDPNLPQEEFPEG